MIRLGNLSRYSSLEGLLGGLFTYDFPVEGVDLQSRPRTFETPILPWVSAARPAGRARPPIKTGGGRFACLSLALSTALLLTAGFPAPWKSNVARAQELPATAPPLAGDPSVSPDRLLPVKVGQAYGFMTKSGRLVLQPRFEFAGSFYEGLAQVDFPPIRGQLAYWIDPPVDHPRIGFIDPTGQTRFLVTIPRNPLQPDAVIDPRVGNFSHGRAVVKIYAADGTSKDGYLDPRGKLVIPATFDVAHSFSEGLAAVERDDPDLTPHWGYINPQGEVVIPLQFHNVEAFTEGLAAVQDPQTKLWGYVDRTGAYAIAPKFTRAWAFSEGQAVVQVEGGKAVIDRLGAASGPLAPAIGPLAQGLAPFNAEGKAPDDPYASDVAIGGRWGFRDAAGNTVIAPQFAYARPFSEGLAAVNLGGVVHDIVASGGNVEGGLWGYIDRFGSLVIKPQFADAGAFQDGVAEVKEPGGLFSGREFHINAKGAEITPIGLSDPKRAFEPEATKPGVKGQTSALALIDLAHIEESEFIAADMMSAFGGGGPNSPRRSYDFFHIEQLRTDMAAFAAGEPPLPKMASNRKRSVSPEVRRETLSLRRAFAACADGDDQEDQEECELAARVGDYENILGDPNMTPVSQQRARANLRLNAAARSRLERRLTLIMQDLRRQVPPINGARPQPVAVKIASSPDINVDAQFHSPTLTITDGLLTDIYFRSLHRAIVGLRLRYGGMSPFGSSLAPKAGVFSANFTRLAYLDRRLPSLRFRALPSRRFADGIVRRCQASRPEERDDLVGLLNSGNDEDVRTKLPYALPAIARYFSCATGASNAELAAYLTEFRHVETANLNDDPLKEYLGYAAEKLQIEAQISAEMTKAITFILAHESYHVWVSPYFGSEAEFDADEHALELYYKVYGRNDIKALVATGAKVDRFGEAFANVAGAFQEMLGRDPVALLKEIYLGTTYYGGNESHPPVALRVARVRKLMSQKRISFTCRSPSRMKIGISVETDGSSSGDQFRTCEVKRRAR